MKPQHGRILSMLGVVSMVDFKMTKEGFVIVIKDYDSLEEVLEELTTKITQMGSFFAKGDKVAVMVENHTAHAQDIPKIISHVRKHGLEVSQILVGTAGKEKIKVKGKMDMVKQPDTKSGTKLIKRNVRSGQIIVHSGDVMIFGNLHKGAEIMAGGSVVVFGSAMGTIRAGLNEGSSAVIAALDLRPSMMQIAGIITHARGEESVPSVAHVKEGKIVIDKFNKMAFERGE